MVQLRRIFRSDGGCSHIIDLTDMLRGALNHLRFRDAVWESSFIVDPDLILTVSGTGK